MALHDSVTLQDDDAAPTTLRTSQNCQQRSRRRQNHTAFVPSFTVIARTYQQTADFPTDGPHQIFRSRGPLSRS